MARTPLFAALRRAARAAWVAVKTDAPADASRADVAERAAEVGVPGRVMSRRTFLRRAGSTVALGAIAAVGLPGCGADGPRGTERGSSSERQSTMPRVAIVGAGMAGVHCAYSLAKRGIPAQLYEATGRIGGRMFSDRETFQSHGLVCERGGELINTSHTTIRSLCAELELPLVDLHHVRAEAGLAPERFWVHGEPLSEETVIEMFRPVAQRMAQDMALAEDDEDAYAELDERSIAEWLDRGDDVDPRLRALLEMAYVPEMGRELSEQSSLLLLEMIKLEDGPGEGDDHFKLLGDSDERFWIAGGNESVIEAMVDRLHSERIHRHRALQRIQQSDSGPYRLSFARTDGGASEEVEADYLVLALPFATLREVTIDVELPTVQANAIQQLRYGTNVKLMTGFTDPVWASRYSTSGATVTDIGDGGVQVLWDTGMGQSATNGGRYGLLTNFIGGELGMRVLEETAAQHRDRIVPLVNAIYPGAAEALDSHYTRMHWPTMPFNKGSYACFGPGQIVPFWGNMATPVGRIYFAGEHVSDDNQGYMEGACETGLAAANAIVARVESGAAQR